METVFWLVIQVQLAGMGAVGHVTVPFPTERHCEMAKAVMAQDMRGIKRLNFGLVCMDNATKNKLNGTRSL